MFKLTKAQIMHLLAIPLTALGGLVTAYASKILPVHIDFTATFITGAGAALSLLIHYLHGLQWFEKNVAPVVDVTDTPAPTPSAHRRRPKPVA
jgi:uncharacterized membrane protein